MTFEKTDYTVVAASTAQEAMQMALSGPVVVLADVVMPDSDGYSLCTTLKQQATTGHIPVLLLTRAGEPVDETKAHLARADGHIKKPFDSGDLIDLVKQVTGAPVETDLPKSFAASLSQRASEGVLTPRAAPAPAVASSPFAAPMAERSVDVPLASDDLGIDDDLLIEEIEIEEPADIAAVMGPTLEPPTPPSPLADRAPVDMWALADGGPQNEGAVDTVEIQQEEVQPLLLEDAVEIVSEPLVPAEVPEPAVPVQANIVTRDIHQADPTRDMGSVPGALASAAAPAIADAVAPIVGAGLSKDELIAVAREVIEQIAWEVVPDLAETIIREELARLTAE